VSTSPAWPEKSGLPVSEEPRQDQHDVDYGKNNRGGSHSHMPFKGNMVKPFQHENSQDCRCDKADERYDAKNDCQGKAQEYDLVD
jgi:hypothetical protein